MFTANMSFFITEAVTNIKRAKTTAFITVSTIAISLVLIGSFLLFSMNIDSFLQQMYAEMIITAYLQQEIPMSDAQAIKLRLSQIDEIEHIRIATPDDAARELFGEAEDQQLLQLGITADNNPLPTTLRITPKTNVDIAPILKALESEYLVENFSYGEDLFEQFKGLTNLLWTVSSSVIFMLGLSSLFIVYNTVRLTLFMRREEIIIMKLVGATNWFVRGPFVVEGTLQGLVASLVAAIILYSGYNFAQARIAELIPFFTTSIGSSDVLKLSAKLCLLGIMLGITGSLFSLRDLTRFSRSTPEGM